MSILAIRRKTSALLAALILVGCLSGQSEAGVKILVDTPDEGVTNGKCSLQEAIYASTFKSNIAISSTNPDATYQTGCTPGDGNGDLIVLAAGTTYTFHHFWEGDGHNALGPTATPIIVTRIIIQGNGAILQSFGESHPANTRLFAIGKGNAPNLPLGPGDLTLHNVYIKNFHVQGGDGASGGGGGLGAGGAIFIADGSLTIDGSTFEQNGANGGNGSAGHSGGGGGLLGRGGSGCYYSAGGGGGSRGDGANSVSPCFVAGGGGGGGGTILSGEVGLDLGQFGSHGAGGVNCGGNGGDAWIGEHHDGRDARCAGGGGGGAAGNANQLCGFAGSCFPQGGNGMFGGGGGGGIGDGGNGDFGGGGGAGNNAAFSISGGNGGTLGGGGGAAGSALLFHNPGSGGFFGGRADNDHGGGGGALGGAIFNLNGRVTITNSTFFNNFVARGESGGGSAANGGDAGGAIFSWGPSLKVNGSTFSGNQSTGSGGAIVVFSSRGEAINFNLHNTIIANNGANECFVTGTGQTGSSVTATGSGNLIMQNGSGTSPFLKCPGEKTSNDPQLQSLQLNSPGMTPTMAISTTSTAAGQAEPPKDLLTDQRGILRPQNAPSDIGAFEVTGTGNCPEAAAFLGRANGVATVDAAHTAAYNDLICGLVEDGTFSKLDALYVLATQSDGGPQGDGIAKLNLIKDNFALVRNGTCAFAANKGISCDGSSGFYDTQLKLSTSGIVFTQDGASYGVYDRSTATTSGAQFGATDGTTFTALNLDFNGGLYARVNSTNDGPIAQNSNPQGFWIGTRTGASAVSVFRNGSPHGSTTTPSSGVPALSAFLCAANLNGTASGFVNDEIAAFFIGGALDPSQASKLSSRINAFMTAFGTNVF